MVVDLVNSKARTHTVGHRIRACVQHASSRNKTDPRASPDDKSSTFSDDKSSAFSEGGVASNVRKPRRHQSSESEPYAYALTGPPQRVEYEMQFY